MPIASTHPEYDKHIAAVCKTQDALQGDVKDYIPRKESQTAEQYNVFRSRPSYYNIVERTTTALVGALTRKPLTINGVYGDTPNVDGAENIEQFVQQSYVELLTGGRIGLLCDFNEEANAPYLVQYNSADITNWSQYFVILREHSYASTADDPYEVKLICKYRELYLDQDGLYAVRVWSPKGKDDWEVTEEYQPLVRGQRLSFIPFVFVNPFDNKPCMTKPPLSTLADINIEHFTLQAQLAHVTWVLSFPLPTIIGDLQDDATGVGFGGDKFLHLKSGGDAKFLEFQGAGSTLIKDTIKAKEEQMFNLGSRLLQYKAGVESSDALQLRLGAEGSSLVTYANSLEAGLTTALTYYNMWFLADDTSVEVYLNKDFTPSSMSPTEMVTLLQLYSANAITIETLMARLYEGEVVDDPIKEVLDLAKLPASAPPAA